MSPRHIAMGVALVLAAGLVIFGDNTPAPQVVGAVERAPRAPAAQAASPAPRASRDRTATVAEPAILRLMPRADLMGDGDEPMGGRSNVFGRQDWNPPPPPVVVKQEMVDAVPAPAPMAPPLPFTLLGKAVADGAWEVYLARGDKTYVVRAQMVLDGMYRVDAIAPPTLTLTYLPLNQVQQLNIGVLD
jgi:hypothetical protein